MAGWLAPISQHAVGTWRGNNGSQASARVREPGPVSDLETDDPTAPQFHAAALVTIDVQQDVLDHQPLEVPGTTEVVPQIAKLAAAFRAHGRTIVHVVRLYEPDGSNAEPCRRQLVRGPQPVLRPGTAGRSLAPGVVPPDADELDDRLLLAGGLQHVTDEDEL